MGSATPGQVGLGGLKTISIFPNVRSRRVHCLDPNLSERNIGWTRRHDSSTRLFSISFKILLQKLTQFVHYQEFNYLLNQLYHSSLSAAGGIFCCRCLIPLCVFIAMLLCCIGTLSHTVIMDINQYPLFTLYLLHSHVPISDLGWNSATMKCRLLKRLKIDRPSDPAVPITPGWYSEDRSHPTTGTRARQSLL